MAVGAKTFWRIQSTAPAGNASGGGFDIGATFDNTLAATSANGNSPVVTSSNYVFQAADVNHRIFIQQGTNWTPGWYIILSVLAGAATLSAAVGAALQFDITKGAPYNRLQANTVAGCATVASPTGGSWAIDYSQVDTAVVSAVADLTIDATVNTLVTSATRSFGVNDIGNMIHPATGTGWTAGYYEIISVAAGAATLDRSPSAAANANKGTWYYGAASSLGSNSTGRTDLTLCSATAPGNRVLIKAGAYTAAAAMTFTNGSANLPTIIEGYNTTPGDVPTGSSCPTIAMGATAFALGTSNQIYNVIVTGTGASILSMATGGTLRNIKSVNSSTTAARAAISGSIGSGYILNCEAISYRGNAVLRGSASLTVIDGCYIHDSDIGISDSGGSVFECFTNNIIADNVTAAIKVGAGITGSMFIRSNTLYGAENKLGTALIIPTAQVNTRFIGNIIYGFVTGVSATDVSQGNTSDYNDYYNNTTDISDLTKWQMGSNDVSVNPAFTNVGQYTGTAATTSGSVLTDGAANFANVVDNVDFCYIISGTGVTAGKYLITGHTSTTVTLDIAPGTSAVADKVYQITTGHNFMPTGSI